MREDRVEQMGVVVDAQLVGHREEHRVGGELLDQSMRFICIAAAVDSMRLLIDVAELIMAFTAAKEVPAVLVADMDDSTRCLMFAAPIARSLGS